ncbi:unnamed protein product [Choristocarpus tenellus]
MASFSAAVLGASGHVGDRVVTALLAEPRCEKILLIGRRSLPSFETEPRIQQQVVDMHNLEMEATNLLRDANIQMCFVTMGIGSPRRVSRDELEQVDVKLPTAFARGAKASATVRHMALLTSVGANVDSKPSKLTGTAAGGGLYMHLKGLVEQNMQEVGFESLGLFRPATLIGNANTPGWAAVASKSISWMLPTKYKEIHIDHLGEAMVKAAVTSLDAKGPAVKIYEGSSLFGLLK